LHLHSPYNNEPYIGNFAYDPVEQGMMRCLGSYAIAPKRLANKSNWLRAISLVPGRQMRCGTGEWGEKVISHPCDRY